MSQPEHENALYSIGKKSLTALLSLGVIAVSYTIPPISLFFLHYFATSAKKSEKPLDDDSFPFDTSHKLFHVPRTVGFFSVAMAGQVFLFPAYMLVSIAVIGGEEGIIVGGVFCVLLAYEYLRLYDKV